MLNVWGGAHSEESREHRDMLHIAPSWRQPTASMLCAVGGTVSSELIAYKQHKQHKQHAPPLPLWGCRPRDRLTSVSKPWAVKLSQPA